MNVIQPLRGWRYDPGRVDIARVVAPPYDIIDDARQAGLYARDDRNFVRIIFGRQFPDDTPQHNRYTRAAAQLEAWREEGLFLRDRPALYPYEQRFRDTQPAAGENAPPLVRRGFFARVLLSAWGEGGVYPHEKTLAGPKADRLELMRATRGDTEPVFALLADPDGRVRDAWDAWVDYPPAVDFVDDEGVANRLWVSDRAEANDAVLALLDRPALFIADGHHRYETALAYRDEIRAAMRAAGRDPGPAGALDCDYILMFIVPDGDPGLVVWPTHRRVHGVADFDAAKLLEGCRRAFTLAKAADEKALYAFLADMAAPPSFGLALPDGLYTLRLADAAAMDARAPHAAPAWRGLDVSVLHLLVLEDLLGIDEGRLLRKENIHYTKDAAEAVGDGRGGLDATQCAFVLRPTRMDQVRAVAEAGAVMPQKSTYFYPKPLSGLLFNLFD